MCVYTPGGMVASLQKCSEKIFANFVSYKGLISLLDDFNLQMCKTDTRMDQETLFALLGPYNLFPIVQDYTRVTISSKSLFDNNFTNYKQ